MSVYIILPCLQSKYLVKKLEKYLKHDKLNCKKAKSKIESQKRVLEMVRAIGASMGYEDGVLACIS